MTTQAFISYAHADEDAAKRLAEELRRREIQVVSIDRLVTPGESWVAQLQKAISRSDVVFVLVSPESQRSQWFTSEMALALSQAEKGRTRVVPVQLDRRTRSPELLQGIQGIELFDEKRAHHQLDLLIQALKGSATPAATQLGRDLNAELIYVRSATEALAREKELHASKRAVWSSTLAAAVSALAVIATVVASIVSFTESPDLLVRDWGLPFATGVLASLFGFRLYALLRRHLMSRDRDGEVR